MSLLGRLGLWLWGPEHPVVAADPAGPAPLAAPTPATHEASWSGMRSVGATSWAQGLTPQRLAGYLRQAGDGDPQVQAELLLEVEDRDLHLVSVLGVRKRAVAGLPWSIEAASDRRTDRRVAEYCTEVFKGVRDLRGSLVHLMGAVSAGYAATEIDWRSAPGRVWIHELLARPASWFHQDRQRPGLWRVRTDGASEGELLAPRAWVWHEARAKSGLHAGTSGLGRALLWAYLFKSFSLKDWVIFSEQYGAPLRIGKYPSGTSEPDRNRLLTHLKALGVDAAAIFPDDVQVEFLEAQRPSSVDVYTRLIEWSDKGMSKAVLGQTLTTEEGKSGSLALGRVHDQVRQDLLESDAEQLSATLTDQVVRPLVDFQFGPQATYPRFLLDARPPEDLKGRADLYAVLGKLGVVFPREHVHATFGVPEPRPGEAVYSITPTPQAQPSGPGTTPEPGTVGMTPTVWAAAPPEDLPPMPAEVERAVRAALERGGYQGWSQVVELLRDYVGQARTVGEVSARLVAACERLHLGGLAPLQEHLADELIRAELIGRVQVREGERPVGDWPAVPPRQAMMFWTEKAALTPAAFASLSDTQRTRAFSVSRFTTLQAVQVIHETHEQALREGWALGEFAAAYEAAIASHGMAPSTPWHVENVFRTNQLTAANAGRWTQQQDPETRAARPYLRYDAVDDGRTRPAHAAMDGRVYSADDPIWQVWYPPNGFQCRCGVVSATAAEVAAEGLRVQTGTPTVRRPRADGQVVEEALVPDEGFRANPGLTPHDFDFSVFPAPYRAALGVS